MTDLGHKPSRAPLRTYGPDAVHRRPNAKAYNGRYRWITLDNAFFGKRRTQLCGFVALLCPSILHLRSPFICGIPLVGSSRSLSRHCGQIGHPFVLTAGCPSILYPLPSIFGSALLSDRIDTPKAKTPYLSLIWTGCPRVGLGW